MTTSIGFGGGEVITVELPLDEVRGLVQEGLSTSTLLEFEMVHAGDKVNTVIINPLQIKVLQNFERVKETV